MPDTPADSAIRQKLQKAVDQLHRMVDNAEDLQNPPDARKAYVRYGRRHLAVIEQVVAEISKDRLPLDDVRARLDRTGDELGLHRDDDKPRLKDRPEFNMGRSTLSGLRRR